MDNFAYRFSSVVRSVPRPGPVPRPFSMGLWPALSLLVAVGCAGVKQQAAGSGAAGAGGNATGAGGRGPTGAGGTGAPIVPEPCMGKCTDFPTMPIFGLGVSPDAAQMFGAPSSNNPPCVTEPEDGSLFPNNWLRPRVRVPGQTGIMKITFHAENQANDLVAYASGETWALPKDIWMNLARHTVDEDVTVTVQLPAGGATTVKFQIAPVSAGGKMVFWAADPTAVGKDPQNATPMDSVLEGFAVGDESTVTALTIDQVDQQVATQGGATQTSHCIGCHTATPDGEYVAFVDAWPWANAFAGVKPGITGDPLPGFAGGTCTSWNTCDAPRTFAQYPWGGPMAFSPAYWTLGSRMAIVATQMKDVTMPWSTDNWQAGRLAWIDLDSTATTTTNGQVNPTPGVAFGYIDRTGDTRAAAFPTWSRDGSTIIYASSACPSPGVQNGCGTQDGRLSRGATDIYQVPYNNRMGGQALPVPGASTPDEEYYPALAPDDRLIAFTRVPAGEEMYANPKAEIYVVPFAKGSTAPAEPVRLVANTPPACTSKVSPGMNNHWPKWSPDVNLAGSRRFYWLVFSSNRYGLPPVTVSVTGQSKVVQISQLYMAAVVVDETSIRTFPAVYLWNQPQTRLNTTPAWDNFQIPIVVD